MLLLFCLNPWSTLCCPNNLNICIKTDPVMTGVSICLAFEYILYTVQYRAQKPCRHLPFYPLHFVFLCRLFFFGTVYIG